MKAQPHRSSKYFETVCCAGIGHDGKWRRQYPVPFRILGDDQKFGRWSWITYKFTTWPKDPRSESQKVVPESISVGAKLKESERQRILNPLVRASFRQADEKRESLTLLRPQKIEITAALKSQSEITEEEEKHAELAAQLSMFDKTAKALTPCPASFSARWTDFDGNEHRHDCDDWETSSAYSRFRRMYGHEKAVEELKQKYEEQYFRAGLALAFSTHSRRNIEFGKTNQWLLVGLVRLNEDLQTDLLLG